MKMDLSTKELTVSAVVADNMIDSVEVVLRMDMIGALGGVDVSRNTVKFSELTEDALLTEDGFSDVKLNITDRDFQMILVEIVGL